MTTFFLLVCSVSVIFFLVFFWQCGKPRRSRWAQDRAVERLAIVAPNSRASQYNLAQLESQMEDFLGSDQLRAPVLVSERALIPESQSVPNKKPKVQQGPEDRYVRETVQQSQSRPASRIDGWRTA